MSTGSGTLRVPGRALPKARVAIVGGLLIAALITVALWAAFMGGSGATDSVGTGPRIADVVRAPGHRPAPTREPASELARAKQLGVEVVPGTAAPRVGEPVAVGGEVCPVCWKYR